MTSRAQPSLIEATARASGKAAERIIDYVDRTGFVRSDWFSEHLEADIFFKLENRQKTGSFKLRGATNRLMTMTDAERDAGCVAASSGNHGAAVACAMQNLGTRGVIFVPEQTSAAKVANIRSFDGNVQFFGTDGLDTEQHARRYAEENGMRYLSPYNDEEVVAGQGSCGVEMLDQCPGIDVVFIAVGGGGLIGGVGAVLKHRDPGIRVVGCQPKASDVMAQSVAAGELLDLPSEPTLSDGTAGGIEADSLTFALNQAVVDEFVTVGEEEIASAMRLYMTHEDQVIEGAAGVAVAALLASKSAVRGQQVAVIICGSNIAAETLSEIMEE